MIKEAIVKIVNKGDLSYDEAYADKQIACPLNGSGRAGAFSAIRPVI